MMKPTQSLSVIVQMVLFCLIIALSSSSNCMTVFALAQPIYINVLIKDPSKVITNKIGQKVQTTSSQNSGEDDNDDVTVPASVPVVGRMKKLVASGVSKIATKVATPSLIAKKMSQKMPTKMTQKMKDNGLTVTIEPVYQQGPYFVLKLNVLNVVPDQLVQTAMKEKLGLSTNYNDDNKNNGINNSNNKQRQQQQQQYKGIPQRIPIWIQKLESLVGEKRQEQIRSHVIPSFISHKMTSEMPKLMGKQLSEKGMMADIHVHEEETKQETFFQSQLNQIQNDSKKKRKQKNLHP